MNEKEMETKQAVVQKALVDAFGGLVSDWAVTVEVVEEDGTWCLHTLASENCAGWKAHGMALYLANTHGPVSRVIHEE